MLLQVGNLLAQQDYDKLEFEYYTTERGLPDDFTSSIMQDQIGYIWIGSKNGLSRFDGFTFKNFEKNQAPLKLRSNRIVDIKEFGDSLTGIVTLYGAHVFNTYNYKSMFFHIPDTSSSSVYVNSVRGFEKLGDNYVFLSPGGFYEFNHAGKIIFEEKSLLKNKKKNLNRSPEGRLLKINSESLIHYSAEKGAELYHSAKKQKIQLPSPSVPAGVNAFARFSYAKTIRKKINDNEYLFVPFDRDSIYYLNISRNILSASPLPFFAEEELWIFNDKIYQLGTNEFVLTSRSGGFYSFKFSTEKKIIFSPRRHLPGINCTSILKDREGRLWISSVTGVYNQKNVNTHIKVFKIPVEKPDEEMLIVPYIYENNFFMSSTSLDFILLDLEKKEIMQKFRFFGSDPNWNTIGSIRNYYQDTLWISTEIGIMWFEMKNFSYGKVTLPGVLKNRPLYLGPATANGKAWLCPFYELPYVCYDIKKRTFEFYSDTSAVKPTFAGARGIINDKDQNTWFYGYGLSRWNYRLQKFDTLIKDFGKLGGFKQFFSSVRADDYGCLWITTPELGLVEYNTRTKKVKTYESINAASLDYVQATSPIIKDKLWLGLTNKLVCFDVKTKKGFVYSDIERLPHSASAPEGFIYDKKTNEFYAAGGGNTIVHFKNETPDNTRKHIIISALSYNETDLIYHPEDSIKLNYNQNSISVYFDVIDFNVKYPQRFKLRMRS